MGPSLLRYRTRRVLGRHPVLFRASVLARPSQWRITVGRSTDVVVDGFPRSGNNFAFEAFRMANPAARMASRTHAPAQIRRGVERGIPTLLLVRDPLEAVLSLLVRQPYLGAREALADHRAFYEATWPFRHGFVVGEFGRVTTDLGGLIEELNRRFGSTFEPYRNTPERDARSLAAIEEHHRAYFGGRVLETHVARPSPEREALKRERRAALEAEDVAETLDAARAVFARYVALAAERAEGDPPPV